MDNFTPLKTVGKKKKRINKFFLIANIFLMFLVVGITGYYLRERLITKEHQAVGTSCNTINDKDDCNSSCSPPKGTNNNQFKCKWDIPNDRCEESGNICGDAGGGGGIVGGRDCTKKNEKCYDCEVKEAGQANHYSCDRVTNLQGGCNDNGRSIGNIPIGFNEFCFDDGPAACGSEQIDWQGDCVEAGGYSGCFISRIGPVACGGGGGGGSTPTPTPTPPAATNTPTPTQPTLPSCNQLCNVATGCAQPPGPSNISCISVGSALRCRNVICPSSNNCDCSTTPTPTRTPTPTPTGTITPSNTPTPTPTGTLTPTPTGTLTPTPTGTLTLTPTNTPGPSATPTPTDVPGAPTATPTEIILAQTTVTSPPPVPVTGMVQSFMYLIPIFIIVIGLIL